MVDVSGDFEIHVTVEAYRADALAEFAAQHGVKFVHVVLDRGNYQSQPMLTLTGSGTLAEQQAVAEEWAARLRKAQFAPQRTKIEAAPWCVGVPRTDSDAEAEPAGRYFEHHIKVLLRNPTATDLVTLADLAEPHGARLSSNARRHRTDGAQERFVTQRCHGAGLATAEHRLFALLETLRAAGQEVLAVEQEYVVVDDCLAYDDGWFAQAEPARWLLSRELKNRSAPAGKAGFPPTYQPVAVRRKVWQQAVFDPALKHYENAYRAGEPNFRDPAAGRRWTAGRREAMSHILAVLADTPWAANLVLRGSVTMAAWIGGAAREPGDLDFVVTPRHITSDSPAARALLDGLIAAISASPGAGLRPEDIAQSAIWTYERADGRRLVIPFSTEDAPDGSVQIDIVFNEPLPIDPAPLTLPDTGLTVLAATAELSLAWKLLWLATDCYPQGKDLYDATLLAEHTTVDLALVRDLIRPELGAEADTFTAEKVLTWDVDWTNFADEHPAVPGTATQWLRRLALALDRGWT